MKLKLKRFGQLGFAAAVMSFANVAFGAAYVTTGQSGAQTQIDVNHQSYFTFTVPGGGATLNGGKFTMKTGTSTTGSITLRVFPGTITSLNSLPSALATLTQTVTQFCTGFANCSQFALHTMEFAAPPTLTGGATYTAVLSTGPDVADVQSEAYFIKPGTVTLADPGAPQPQLIKEFSVSSLTVNQPATMTLSLSNNGTAAVSSVAFTDTLPSGMNFTTNTVGNTCGGSASISGNVLTVSGIGLSVGSSCAITATITVTAPGSYTNTTSAVSSSDGTAAAGSASLTGVAAAPVGTPSLTFWGMMALAGLLVAFAAPRMSRSNA